MNYVDKVTSCNVEELFFDEQDTKGLYDFDALFTIYKDGDDKVRDIMDNIMFNLCGLSYEELVEKQEKIENLRTIYGNQYTEHLDDDKDE